MPVEEFVDRIVHLAPANAGSMTRALDGVKVWDANGWTWLGLSPLRLMLVGAVAICWGLWRMRRGPGLFVLASSASLIAIAGHTPEAMRRLAHVAWGATRYVAYAAVPSSRAGWGTMLFALAFLLLGVGAWITWRHLPGVRERKG